MNEPKQPDAPAGGRSREQWHEAVPGDTLSKIAKKSYDDPSLYPSIFEVNQDVLKSPDLIPVGQTLRIP